MSSRKRTHPRLRTVASHQPANCDGITAVGTSDALGRSPTVRIGLAPLRKAFATGSQVAVERPRARPRADLPSVAAPLFLSLRPLPSGRVDFTAGRRSPGRRRALRALARGAAEPVPVSSR